MQKNMLLLPKLLKQQPQGICRTYRRRRSSPKKDKAEVPLIFLTFSNISASNVNKLNNESDPENKPTSGRFRMTCYMMRFKIIYFDLSVKLNLFQLLMFLGM